MPFPFTQHGCSPFRCPRFGSLPSSGAVRASGRNRSRSCRLPPRQNARHRHGINCGNPGRAQGADAIAPAPPRWLLHHLPRRRATCQPERVTRAVGHADLMAGRGVGRPRAALAAPVASACVSFPGRETVPFPPSTRSREEWHRLQSLCGNPGFTKGHVPNPERSGRDQPCRKSLPINGASAAEGCIRQLPHRL